MGVRFARSNNRGDLVERVNLDPTRRDSISQTLRTGKLCSSLGLSTLTSGPLSPVAAQTTVQCAVRPLTLKCARRTKQSRTLPLLGSGEKAQLVNSVSP